MKEVDVMRPLTDRRRTVRAAFALWRTFARAASGALGAGLLLAAGVASAQAPSLSPSAPAAPLTATPPLSTPSLTAPDPVEQRWQSTFAAWAAADRINPPPPGGVLFVGSSSIRLWNNLETQFSALPVIVKRGFGGSLMSDCTAELRRLVLPYKPRLVIVYAGDNDLAEGRTPQQVLKSYTGFVEGVRRALPDTRIAFISIKPSPVREKLLPAIRKTNALVASYTARVEEPRLHRRLHADARRQGPAARRALPRRPSAPERRGLRVVAEDRRGPRSLTRAARRPAPARAPARSQAAEVAQRDRRLASPRCSRCVVRTAIAGSARQASAIEAADSGPAPVDEAGDGLRATRALGRRSSQRVTQATSHSRLKLMAVTSTSSHSGRGVSRSPTSASASSTITRWAQ